MALLREIYGKSPEKQKIATKAFQTPSGKKLELTVISSNSHIEFTPRYDFNLLSDVGIYDRFVIQDLLKEIAQTPVVDGSSARSFKVVIINEAEQLSKDAQHALRRTMEKYMKNLRLILITTNMGKLISPVKSRCLAFRVPFPSTEAIQSVLESTGRKEDLIVPKEISSRIANASEGNLRKALLLLDVARRQQF